MSGGHAGHFEDPIEIAPELCRFSIKRRQFLLSHLLVFGRLLDLLNVLQTADALANCRKIGQRASEPALIYVKLAASQRRLFYRFLRLFLAAHEQDLASTAGHLPKKLRGAPKLDDGLIQIDDVNLISLFENERFHFRIPALGLMPKMDARFQEFRH